MSNGYFKNNRGTSAGIINKKGKAGKNVRTLNRVQKLGNDHSTYQTELDGVYSTITLTDFFWSKTKCKKGRIE